MLGIASRSLHHLRAFFEIIGDVYSVGRSTLLIFVLTNCEWTSEILNVNDAIKVCDVIMGFQKIPV